MKGFPFMQFSGMSTCLHCFLVLLVTSVVISQAGTLERRSVPRSHRVSRANNRAIGRTDHNHGIEPTPVVSSGDADSEHLSTEGTECPGCAKGVSASTLQEAMSPGEFRKVMIELVKIKLLKKLNLKKPPVINASRILDIPAPLIPNLHNEMQMDDHRTQFPSRMGWNKREQEGVTLEKVALIGEEEYYQHDVRLSLSRHFGFNIRDKVFRYAVQSAGLWLTPEDINSNVTAIHTLFISDTHGHHRNTVELPGVPGRILAKGKLRAGKGTWMRFDVTDAVRNWVKRRRSHIRLTVTCLGCDTELGKLRNVPIRTDAEFRPFLVIETKKRATRRRRNVNYHTPLGGCFLEELYINFTEIGWHTWIRQPAGYNANFCKGSCVNHDVLPSYSRVMMEVIKSKPRNTNFGSLLAPCCAAVETSSISILYEVDPNQFIYEKLDNMVADACDCR